MKNENERELLRQLEEPLNRENRCYPLDEQNVLVTMLDSPYYPPYMPDSLHYHNCLEIGVCISGYGSVQLQQTVHSFSTGSLIVAPRGVYHRQQNAGEPLTHWRYLVINEELLQRRVSEPFLSPVASLLSGIRASGLFFECPSAESGVLDLINMMFTLHHRYGAEAKDDLTLCCVLLLSLIARLDSSMTSSGAGSPAQTHLRQPIEPALTYVYEHYKEDIRIEALARSCSMSESYFRKMFLAIMGQPPLEYVNRYRVHRSLNLLRTTSDSVQNIAMRTGFASIAAYNRNFKRYVGSSPTRWRKEHGSTP